MPRKDPEARRQYDKEYRLVNIDRLRQYDRDRNPDRYWKNPEANREKRKRYYYRHKELELARKSEHDEKERENMETNFIHDPAYRLRLWKSAKQRAEKANVPFTISPDDIVIPEFCPVLGIKLKYSRGSGFKDSSPSVDRRIPKLGYTLENIRVISYRANAIKRDASLEELEKLVRYLKEE